MTTALDAPPPTRRLRATVEYDGADFVGWQAQSERHGRSVQRELEQALTRITGETIRVVGAGRTDSGVHAWGQVVHFDTTWPGSLEVLQRALNAVLPRDVGVAELVVTDVDFHARYSARQREYVYTILNRPTRAPLYARTAWHVPQPLDIDSMQAAGAVLVGRHSFRAFGRPMREAGSTVRRVDAITVARVELASARGGKEDRLITVTVRADAFLRHMVRRMVFALVEVGRGRLTLAQVAAILASEDPQQLHGMAPPQGLCLTQVMYEPDKELSSENFCDETE